MLQPLKEQILAYLDKFLQQPALDRIADFNDDVFTRATKSIEIVNLGLDGQVKLFYQEGCHSFWRYIRPSTDGDYKYRCAQLERCLLTRLLVKQLTGQEITPALVSMFGSDAVRVIRSRDPLVSKIREHLGAAMTIMELVSIRASIALSRELREESQDLDSDDVDGTSQRIITAYDEKFDEIEKLFEFRRTTSWL